MAENGVVGGFKDVTMEEVVKWNPDFIICRDAHYKPAILSDPAWQDIEAVKKGNVLINPQGVFYWCVRSAEEAIQKLWIAKVLHPEKFPDLDLVEETKYFYKTFHYYELSDADVEEILNPKR